MSQLDVNVSNYCTVENACAIQYVNYSKLL